MLDAVPGLFSARLDPTPFTATVTLLELDAAPPLSVAFAETVYVPAATFVHV
jgi:hypothetical protein